MKKRKNKQSTKRKVQREVDKKHKKTRSLIYPIVILILFLALFTILYLSYYSDSLKKSEVIKEEIKIGERSFIFSKRADIEKAPVIIVLHGGLQDSSIWFEENEGNGQAAFVKKAINEEYAIIAPDSVSPLCKDIKQWDYREESSDLIFFDEIFNWIWFRNDLDSERIYVTGISIGGFMTSRLAEHYGQNINAIAVNSGGNADNIYLSPNNLCYIEYNFDETPIKDDHPRTLLIHGINDSIIPYETSVAYYSSLRKSGTGVKLILEKGGEHNWYAKYNDLILEWFD